MRPEKGRGSADVSAPTRGDCLIVDGQRVCPGPQMEFKGKDAAVDCASIPLGYEVKAEGVRDADGNELLEPSDLKTTSTRAVLRVKRPVAKGGTLRITNRVRQLTARARPRCRRSSARRSSGPCGAS